MEENEKTLSEYLEAFRRRKGRLFGVALTILAISLVVAFAWPPTYKSTATILIEQQEIPQDLVRSTVTSYADQRIQMISQRVMTTSNLSGIIEKYDLYADERQREPLETILDEMRDDIALEMVSADVVDPKSGRATTATIAFTLSFENRDPALAQKVDNELVSLFLNENLKSRTEMAKETTNFLADEAQRLDAHVNELEKKLASFKEKNAGALPELINVNMDVMDRTEREMSEVERQINSLKERQIYLESELLKTKPITATISEAGERILGPADKLKVLQTQYLSASARYAPDHPDVVNLRKEIEALKKEVGGSDSRSEMQLQLDGKRAELASIRKKYSPAHPDVKRLQREISNIDKELKKAPERIMTSSSDTPDNPAYIQLAASLEATRSDLSSYYKKQKELHAKLADYEGRLTQTPQVEREYRNMMRDYENSVAKYNEITAKQMEAKLAQNLETERKSERFTLIDPPLLPEEPDKPNRLALVFLGFVFSFAGGVGSVAVAESMDTTIYGRRGVIEVLGAPPLAVIPIMETGADKRSRFMKRLLAVLLILALIAGALLAVHLFIKPLDVIWYAGLRKLGMG